MKTRKWVYLTLSALLLVTVAVGLSAGAAAAPGAAPSAPIPGTALDPLAIAACDVDTTVIPNVRTCELWARPGTIDLPGMAGLPIWGFGTSLTGPALVPGPIVRANAGETLEVVLHNELPGQDVSLAFPGQAGLVPDTTGVATGGTVSRSSASSRLSTSPWRPAARRSPLGWRSSRAWGRSSGAWRSSMGLPRWDPILRPGRSSS